MLGSFVKSGFLRQGNCTSIVTKDFIGPDALGMTPRSDMNSFIQTPLFAASEAAMYSASHVDPATALCLELHPLLGKSLATSRILGIAVARGPALLIRRYS